MIPEKRLTGISLLTYNRWPLWPCEPQLSRKWGPLLFSPSFPVAQREMETTQHTMAKPWQNAITCLCDMFRQVYCVTAKSNSSQSRSSCKTLQRTKDNDTTKSPHGGVSFYFNLCSERMDKKLIHLLTFSLIGAVT